MSNLSVTVYPFTVSPQEAVDAVSAYPLLLVGRDYYLTRGRKKAFQATLRALSNIWGKSWGSPINPSIIEAVYEPVWNIDAQLESRVRDAHPRR